MDFEKSDSLAKIKNNILFKTRSFTFEMNKKNNLNSFKNRYSNQNCKNINIKNINLNNNNPLYEYEKNKTKIDLLSTMSHLPKINNKQSNPSVKIKNYLNNKCQVFNKTSAFNTFQKGNSTGNIDIEEQNYINYNNFKNFNQDNFKDIIKFKKIRITGVNNNFLNKNFNKDLNKDFFRTNDGICFDNLKQNKSELKISLENLANKGIVLNPQKIKDDFNSASAKNILNEKKSLLEVLDKKTHARSRPNNLKNKDNNLCEEYNNSFIDELTDLLNNVTANENNKDEEGASNTNKNINSINEVKNKEDDKQSDNEDKEPDPRINFEHINQLNKLRPQTSYGGLNARRKNLQSALQNDRLRILNNNNVNNNRPGTSFIPINGK